MLEKYMWANMTVLQGARDNLGILFELNFQFLIPGLSLETTEQVDSY